MSAPTFKVGDRVARINTGSSQPYPRRLRVGTVEYVHSDAPMVRVQWPDGGNDQHYYPDELRHVTPMSPEAKMVWHAMRAGAKRLGRYHWTGLGGVTYRIHKYSGPNIRLMVEVKLPPLEEDGAGR